MAKHSIFAKLILLTLVTVLILATVYASDEESPGSEPQPTIHELTAQQDSIFSLINSQYQAVKPIFEQSCFDCHSEYTDYPWYHSLPIIKGILDGHIEEAREYVDLSPDFPFEGKGTTLEILGEIREVIEEEEMPLLSYRLLHWGSLIDGAERDSVFTWIDNATSMIEDFYGQHRVEQD